MRKFLIASVAALMAVAGVAVIAHATKGEADTEWKFKFTTQKKKATTGTDSYVKPSKKNADGSYNAASKNVVFFPFGTKFDNTAAPICRDSPSEFGRTEGRNCKRTIVGDGQAISVVGSGAEQRMLASTLTAYNKRDGLWFVIQPCAEGTGPGTGQPCTKVGSPIILDAQLDYADRKKNQARLTVVTPKAILEGGVVIETFQLVTKRITKTIIVRKGNKRIKRKKHFFKTPPTCPRAGWESRITITSKDGSKQTIRALAPCNR